MLAVIDGSKATAYTFESFEGDTKVIYGKINDKDIVLIGNNDKQFMMAFENKLNNDKRTFSISTADKQMTLKDDIGNTYDLFGNVTIGPNLGESLPTIPSFMAYWFSVGTFYNNPIIR